MNMMKNNILVKDIFAMFLKVIIFLKMLHKSQLFFILFYFTLINFKNIGRRIDGKNIDIVAFKVSRPEYNSYLSIEYGIYEKIGDHGKNKVILKIFNENLFNFFSSSFRVNTKNI